MNYEFLVETYRTERIKVLSLWSMFDEADFRERPRRDDPRGRSLLEQMIHQCVSEDLWFKTMLDIDTGGSALPENETKIEFLRRYAEDSANRLEALKRKSSGWWEEIVDFFEVKRSRAWIMTRRLNHTAHHRGQQTAIMRLLGRDLYSTYGPTADTGGLMQNRAPTIYAYPDETSLLDSEMRGGDKSILPPPGDQPVTERPD